jgi:serine/threonine-protein kinase
MPDPTPSRPTADRNLLFGILALQMDFISRDALIQAMQAWLLNKSKSLGQLLVEQDALLSEAHALLEPLVQKHLELHGDDPQQSLASVRPSRSVESDLQGIIRDSELREAFHDLLPSLALCDSTRPTGPDVGTSDGRDTQRDPTAAGSRYRILRPHAKGGLGAVYVALDQELHREVALKEIQECHAHDPVSRGRFLLEAEVTGRLEHPGIVPVYGLGQYADGRPFYAMRFIKGDNLKAAIKHFHEADAPGRDPSERSLEFRQLLGRFVDVCHAVAYAHSRGVLHRDLKPGNIMLGKYGETLVVDWGLAKPIDRPEPARTADETTFRPSSGSGLGATQAGTVIGTPAYMSPEQAAGRLDQVGRASDIYSLGATLYTVLTGRTPFEKGPVEDVLRKVQRGEVVWPRQAKPGTPSTLDAICRKAMALQPEERYPTASALAADVEHWLADEPVHAYGEPLGDRLRRWGRRHRPLVAGATVFLVMAVAGLSASTAVVSAEQRETEKQRLIAVKNYEISRKQAFNIIKLIEETEPELAAQPALHDRRRELLTTTATACRQFLEQDPDDLTLRERAAHVFRTTANFHRMVYETREAEALYNDSLLLRAKLAEEFDTEPSHRLQLAYSLKDYANLQIQKGRLAAAAKNLNRALALADELLKDDPQVAAYLRIKASVLHHIAAVGYTKEEPKLDSVLESIDLYRKLLAAPKGRHPYDPIMLAAALNAKALIERDAGQLKVAGATHREANEIVDEEVKKKPIMVSFPDLLLFRVLLRMEQAKSWAKDPQFLPLAERTVGQAVEQCEGLAGNYPQMPIYREKLAVAYQLRGSLREQLKRLDEAKADFNKAQSALGKLVDKYGDLPEVRGELGKSYAGMGRVTQKLGENGAAEWLQMARTELRRAADEAPEHAEIRHALEELKDVAHP